jgi:hypothetical protein
LLSRALPGEALTGCFNRLRALKIRSSTLATETFKIVLISRYDSPSLNDFVRLSTRNYPFLPRAVPEISIACFTISWAV